MRKTTGGWYRSGLLAIMLGVLVAPPVTAQDNQVRIKDLAQVQMGNEMPLTGLGLVIGLEGTGDGRRADFTFQMMANMMHNMHLAVEPNQLRVRNVAGVTVTAVLPPFARQGTRIDVQVASLGDARSLQGGTLVQSTLMGPDGSVYAIAQGPLSIGGYNLGGMAPGAVRKNHSVVGAVPGGGIVTREVRRLEYTEPELVLLLYEEDWTTAARTADAIDTHFESPGLAEAVDPATVIVALDEERRRPANMVEFVSRLEEIRVVPDVRARVVVNERTGTVIIGEHVSVSAVALAHGGLKLKIPGPAADDPWGFGVEVEEEPDRLHPIISSFDVGAMPTVRELVRSLNALGVTPRDLIAIMQSLKTAGALRAELIIQ